MEGPNALARLYDEIGFMDRKVTRNTLRKAFTGKRTTVVLEGTTTTPVALSGTTIGSMTVTTTLTLTLVGSR